MSVTRTLVEHILRLCREAGVMVATAESCTGGLVAGAITEVSGSSAALDRGFVTYSNAAKMELLGVSEAMLQRFGAVSAETAEAMAEGALSCSRAFAIVSVTGIAGPDGGSAEKPVGLVWFGSATRSGPVRSLSRLYAGRSRAEVRAASVEQALALLVERLGEAQAGAGP